MLSVCMIVRDEAAHFASCLASLEELGAELVVVDTGSRDCTPALARQAGARVISSPWADDFAAARNVSLEQAHGEWVLVLDADEILASGAAAAINAAIQQPARLAFSLLHYGAPSHTPCRMVRLFQRHPGLRFQGVIHEHLPALLPLAQQLGWPIEACRAAIIHMDSTDDVERQRAKTHRNKRLLEQALDAGDRRPYLRALLAERSLALGEVDKAYALLDSVIGEVLHWARQRTSGDPGALPAVWQQTQRWLALGSWDEAWTLCEQAEMVFPHHPWPVFMRGLLLAEAGHFQESRTRLARVLTLASGEGFTGFPPVRRELVEGWPRLLLALIGMGISPGLIGYAPVPLSACQ